MCSQLTSAEKNIFGQAVDIKPFLAHKLIQDLKKEGIEYIVAPFEADPQLGKLCLNRSVDFVVSEDSDCLVFGCTSVLTKLGRGSSGNILEGEYLNLQDILDSLKISFSTFVDFCILCGCDYLKNIKGFGPEKAYLAIQSLNPARKSFSSLDTLRTITRTSNGKFFFDDEYKISFLRTKLAFKFHPVFQGLTEHRLVFLNNEDANLDPTLKELKQYYMGQIARFSLKPHLADLCTETLDLSFLKPDLFKLAEEDTELLKKIAQGDFDPENRKPFPKGIEKSTNAHESRTTSAEHSRISKYFSSKRQISPQKKGSHNMLDRHMYPTRRTKRSLISQSSNRWKNHIVTKPFKPLKSSGSEQTQSSLDSTASHMNQSRVFYQSKLVSPNCTPLPFPKVPTTIKAKPKQKKQVTPLRSNIFTTLRKHPSRNLLVKEVNSNVSISFSSFRPKIQEKSSMNQEVTRIKENLVDLTKPQPCHTEVAKSAFKIRRKLFALDNEEAESKKIINISGNNKSNSNGVRFGKINFTSSDLQHTHVVNLVDDESCRKKLSTTPSFKRYTFSTK
eukprot:snap_masked-scaffold_3-processed-gene-9.1-mRNA-1 protein AED:0.80 eAED:0.80 QI:0/-1/0/1/-1/1/1/0/559